MNSISRDYLSNLTFTAEQVSALRNLGECRGRQALYIRQRPEVLEGLRTVATIESTDSSNRLEGITVPGPRIKDLVLRNTNPRNRSEQEIAGYRDALELIHEARQEMPITTNVIRQLHTRIYGYLGEEGGRWKPADNDIVERGKNGEIIRVRFHAVSAVATPQAMDSLVEQYALAEQARREALVLIPLFVLDFLCIHPFRDGNGRVARLLTLLLLYHFGYEVGRYISLERLFEKSKEGYYENLEASSKGWHEAKHDVNPWLNYFWGVLQRAYNEFEERVGQIGSGRGSKSQQVRDAVTRKLGSFAISDLERDCPGVSKETIRSVLQAMRKEGLVELRGRGRGARWRQTARRRR
jgi:Fic family protein